MPEGCCVSALLPCATGRYFDSACCPPVLPCPSSSRRHVFPATRRRCTAGAPRSVCGAMPCTGAVPLVPVHRPCPPGHFLHGTPSALHCAEMRLCRAQHDVPPSSYAGDRHPTVSFCPRQCRGPSQVRHWPPIPIELSPAVQQWLCLPRLFAAHAYACVTAAVWATPSVMALLLGWCENLILACRWPLPRVRR